MNKNYTLLSVIDPKLRKIRSLIKVYDQDKVIEIDGDGEFTEIISVLINDLKTKLSFVNLDLHKKENLVEITYDQERFIAAFKELCIVGLGLQVIPYNKK
jgi:hypothetical protein